MLPDTSAIHRMCGMSPELPEPARQLAFRPDGRSSCERYYIRSSFDERQQEDVYKAFYRPNGGIIEELSDWTWAREVCVDACERHCAEAIRRAPR